MPTSVVSTTPVQRSPSGLPGSARRHWPLLAALAIALLARIPGAFWGANYPTGWTIHHIDEYTHLRVAAGLINQAAVEDPAGHRGYPDGVPDYPRGMAAHVAVPLMALRALTGRFSGPLPSPRTVVTVGRVVSVFYGVATVLVMFLLVRLFTARIAVAYLAAGILALSGMHVTQSHFFLGDVPALFWTLLGLFLLGRHLEADPDSGTYWSASAFCMGAAFGIKLMILGLPSLAITAALSRSRVARLLSAAVYFVAGFCIVSLNAYSPSQLYRTVKIASAVGIHGYHFSRLAGALIYGIELPALVSFPIVVLAACGTFLLCRELLEGHGRLPRRSVVLLLMLPAAVALWVVLFKSDNFPRHLLPFVPWSAAAAAYCLTRVMDYLSERRFRPAWVIVPLFLYLGVFVFDEERVFWNDPRNRAEQWLIENVPEQARASWLGGRSISPFAAAGYTYTPYPGSPAPDIIICEMHYANMFLSGMGLRDSYPADNSTVWPWFRDAASMHAWQDLFRGRSPYRQVARFSEGYFMPERVWTDRLIGNRSRNYVGEVVIFGRADLAITPR
jgi:hypothetical protein